MIFDNMHFVHNINIEAAFQTFRSRDIKLILLFIDLKFDNFLVRDFSGFECFKAISLNECKINCEYDYSRVAFMIIEHIIEFRKTVELFNVRDNA